MQVGALNDFLLPHEPEKANGRGKSRSKGKGHPSSLSTPVKLDPKLPEALLHEPSPSDGDSEAIRCTLRAVADAAVSAASATRATAAAAAAVACCCSLLAVICIFLLLVGPGRSSDSCRP